MVSNSCFYPYFGKSSNLTKYVSKGVETIWIIWHWHFHHCAPKNCLRNSFRHLIAQTGDWHFLSWNGLTRPEGEPARIIGHNGSGVSKWRRKNSNQKTTSWKTKWWFQTFFIFTPTWVNDAIWLWVIYFQMGWNHQLLVEEEWQPEWCGNVWYILDIWKKSLLN